MRKPQRRKPTTSHQIDVMMPLRKLPVLALFLTLGICVPIACGTADAAEVRNVVILHDAFADGSGWRDVAAILGRHGLNVTVVQEPITSLADDVAATRRVLDQQRGPVILVGHSYGGMVITEAGRHDAVAGLVYVAVLEPDRGESLIGLAKASPPAGHGIRETADGQFLYLDPAAFHTDFAADLPTRQSDFMARAQVYAAKVAFAAPVGEPAWRGKPSWAVVATQDRSINPDLERSEARRAASRVSEIIASHAVYVSQPERVAAVIEIAARSAQP